MGAPLFLSVILEQKLLRKLMKRIITLLFLFFPFVALIWGIYDSVKNGLDPFYIYMFGAFYMPTSCGITVGHHRYFTHDSFKTSWLVEFFLAVCGTMAIQGRLREWVGNHKDHHWHSDRKGDPHSPHEGFGDNFWGLCKGFLFAQFGWLLSHTPSASVRKLKLSPVAEFVDRTTPVWYALSGILPATIGYLHTLTWEGAWLGFLWGGLIRLFALSHSTWLVNSYCHLFGRRKFDSRDKSTDSFLVALLTNGEGFHNGHHAFPKSALHGIDHRGIDVSYLIIKTMEFFGLVWNVRVPSPMEIEAKRLKKV
jgi:stearoyl-CoA desaturase (Delta-9 desaturase)